jgi:DNA-binding HxlR family transcriptional regulator
MQADNGTSSLLVKGKGHYVLYSNQPFKAHIRQNQRDKSMTILREPPNIENHTDNSNGDNHAEWLLFQRGSELLGRRWTGVILYMLLQKQHRFNELLGAIPGISDRLLTERLRELEENGLVERLVIPESPVRVVYRLTDTGRAARDVIAATYRWANKWLTAANKD